MTAFPRTTAELSPGLLTEALAEQWRGTRVSSVTVVDEAHCDTGSASTAARAVLDLTYERDPADLPGRMVLKTVLVRPGAPGSMYLNEVRFYRRIRPDLSIETPRCYAATYDEASGSFGLLLEDLTARGARFPDAREAMSVERMATLLDHLASLHATWWADPRLDTELDWLWTPYSGGFHDFLDSMGLEFIRGQMERSEYKQALLADRLGRSLDDLWVDLWRAQELVASEPTTLLHGDTHFGNTYLLPDGGVGLLDWQLLQRGRWCHDVTYALVTSLSVEDRRRHERELLAGYLDALGRRGVGPPSLDEAWECHRRVAIWGFLVGWFLTPIENYGPEILHANLDRLATALEDLGTIAALAR
ncbi:MAG: phosphotransferase [Acidimicrobiia bacterium]|nr:phosphotransferase [Acidimicrobiia bacterium]